MKNTTHRVVILKNINSNMISQAILFLKDSAAENDTNLILEAEKIVEKYMSTKTMTPPLKTKISVRTGILSAGLAIISLGIFIILRLI